MKQMLNKLLHRHDAASTSQPVEASTGSKPVVVVSGLPRSGTSMMMKMLEAGGLPVLIDGLRAADTDNPEGYYEYERVKALDKGDTVWAGEARGHGVKIISALVEFLPAGHSYRVIFMNRQTEEVLRSQRKMLEHRGETTTAISDAEMAVLFAKHVEKVKAWMHRQPNFALLEVNYNAMLVDPLPHIRAVNQFLDNRLDEQRMAEVVNPDLYRNRA